MFINNKMRACCAALILAALPAPRDAGANHGGCNEVHAAAFLDEPAELSHLIAHGVDLNCRDVLFQTPLITATDGASLTIVKMLLKQGVHVNARDELGETALAKARRKQAFFDMKGGETYHHLYRDMIALLVEAGARE